MADPITVKVGKLDDVSKLAELSEVEDTDLSRVRDDWKQDPPKPGYTNLLDATPLPSTARSDTLLE